MLTSCIWTTGILSPLASFCLNFSGHGPLFFLVELVESVYVGWFLGTDPAFKYCPQIFSQVEVEALRRPFLKLNVSLICPIRTIFDVFRIIVLMEHPTVSKFEPPSRLLEVKLKISKVVLCYFNPSAPYNDGITTLLDRWYNVLWFESPPRIKLQTAQYLSCLTI